MRIKKDNFLLTRPIAHRGLWGEGFTENSLSAYRNAADKSPTAASASAQAAASSTRETERFMGSTILSVY